MIKNGTFTRESYGGEVAAGHIRPRFHYGVLDSSTGDQHTVEMVQLLIPGDLRSSPVEIVTDVHRQQYRLHYDAFKRSQAMPENGLPLSAWGAISPEQVRQYERMNVLTVEELAALGDELIGGIMGARALRDRARKHIEAAQENAALNRLIEHEQRLRQENEGLKQQLQALSQRVDALVLNAGPPMADTAPVVVPLVAANEDAPPPVIPLKGKGKGDSA